jgi:pilus assembly protein CpaC
MSFRHKFVWTGAGILLVALAQTGSIVWAQSPVLSASAVAAPNTGAAAVDADPNSVRLLVGRSTVLDVGTPIARVSLTSADVADALVTSPSQLLINGKMPGTISMFVWDRAGALRRYELTVQRDLALLAEQMKQLFPSESISVHANGKNVVLTGSVSSKDLIEKAVNVAAGYVEKKEEVTTLLQLGQGAATNQVLLRVRFAEVSRSAMTELGVSFGANGVNNGRYFGRSTTQQFAAPEWDEQGRFVFSDFLNLFFFDSKEQLAVVVKALSEKGLFQSLAEPNLVAESGKEASFLAGGEIPIPIAQGSGANIGVSVVFKEFGVRLNFTPTVNGDRIHLKVKPEVSALDFNNSVVLAGFRIPALTTRRTETELELRNGQTFAIAGLMNNTMLQSLQKIPGLGDIPILGYLFRSKAAEKNQTELVVMITPEILPNDSRGVTPNLPRTPERFLEPLQERRTQPMPPPAFPPQAAAPNAAPGAAAVVPGTTPNPNAQSAAAAVSALTPAAPRVTETGAPAASAATVTPGSAPPAGAPRPMTEEEQKDLEKRARAEAQAYARAQAVEGRRIAEEQVKQEKAAKEQAKRDAESAKKSQEAAKKQAEIDRERQKQIDEAAARLKAAESAYQAELARQNKQ